MCKSRHDTKLDGEAENVESIERHNARTTAAELKNQDNPRVAVFRLASMWPRRSHSQFCKICHARVATCSRPTRSACGKSFVNKIRRQRASAGVVGPRCKSSFGRQHSIWPFRNGIVKRETGPTRLSAAGPKVILYHLGSHRVRNLTRSCDSTRCGYLADWWIKHKSLVVVLVYGVLCRDVFVPDDSRPQEGAIKACHLYFHSDPPCTPCPSASTPFPTLQATRRAPP